MILIKLGGSIVTDKNSYRVFNVDAIRRLCKEIKYSGEKVIVVHGAGSFGHILAKEYSLSSGFSDKRQIHAVARVQCDVRELDLFIINELLNAGIPAISVPPGSCFVMDDGKLILEEPEVLLSASRLDLMPVMFGDVVLDRSRGFGICSGDQIMEVLCDLYKPDKVVFVSDVDGLFDKDPKTNLDAMLLKEVTSETLKKISTECSTCDVTGGVMAKMEAMLRMASQERDCVLVNGSVEGRLYSVLKGERVISTTAKGGL
jgi:isopentenyl phosphate kinase